MRDETDNPWNYDYIRLAWDSGFHFTSKKSDGLINLNSLSLVDIERTVSERDIASVERHINTIINYNLDEEQTRILDGTFVKVFKLGQLAIQYLLFCKKYLDHTVTLLKKDIHQLNEENRNLLEETDNQKQDIMELRRRFRDFKQVIEPGFQQSPEKAHQCNQCAKMFATEEFLAGHVKRRHEQPPLMQTEADKLQLEIKELKERLNSTEKYIQLDKNDSKEVAIDNKEINERTNSYVEIQSEVERLRIKLENQTKTIEEHKDYQAKYEKWMEMAFEKFEKKQVELLERTIKPNETKTTWTQTTENRSIETQYEPMNASSNDVVNQNDDLQEIKRELIKIQGDIEQEAKNRFEKLEGFLEEKVSDKFAKFSKQMEQFYNRIEEIQTKSKSSASNINANLPVVLYEKSQDVKKSQQQQQPPVIQFAAQSSDETSSDDYGLTVRPARQPKMESSLSDTPPFEPIQQPSRLQPPKPQPRQSISQTYSRGVNKQYDERPVRDRETNVRPMQAAGDFTSDETDVSKMDSKVIAKPSVTSTLGQRSITSLKRAANDEDVKTGLSKELEDLLNARLLNFGISPDWNELPKSSFAKAMSVIKHQSSLAKKRIPKYDRIRKDLIKAVDLKAKTTSLESLLRKRKSIKKISHKETPPVVQKPLYDTTEDTSESLASNVMFYKPTTRESTEKEHTEKKEPAERNQARDKKEPTDKKDFREKKELRVEDKRTINEEVAAESRMNEIHVAAGEEIVNDDRQTKASIVERPKESVEGAADASKVKKKVLFDLESLSRNSSDAEKLEAIGKKSFAKPAYIDELKTLISGKKAPDFDATLDSLTLDDDIGPRTAAAKEKDADASDWDISDILN